MGRKFDLRKLATLSMPQCDDGLPQQSLLAFLRLSHALVAVLKPSLGCMGKARMVLLQGQTTICPSLLNLLGNAGLGSYGIDRNETPAQIEKSKTSI